MGYVSYFAGQAGRALFSRVYRRGYNNSMMRGNLRGGARRITANRMFRRTVGRVTQNRPVKLYRTTTWACNAGSTDFDLTTATNILKPFNAGQVDFGDFSNLFDQYRLVGVSLRFLPDYDNNNLAALPSGTKIPTITMAVDKDSNTAIAGGETALLDYQGCKTRQLTKRWKIYIKNPAVKDILQVNSSGVTTSSGVRSSPWLDTADTSIAHYGLQYYIQNLPSGFSGRMVARYFFEFRNIH